MEGERLTSNSFARDFRFKQLPRELPIVRIQVGQRSMQKSKYIEDKRIHLCSRDPTKLGQNRRDRRNRLNWSFAILKENRPKNRCQGRRIISTRRIPESECSRGVGRKRDSKDWARPDSRVVRRKRKETTGIVCLSVSLAVSGEQVEGRNFFPSFTRSESDIRPRGGFGATAR